MLNPTLLDCGSRPKICAIPTDSTSPVSAEKKGWRTFLEASNQFYDDRSRTCSNQTFDLMPEIASRIRKPAQDIRRNAAAVRS